MTRYAYDPHTFRLVRLRSEPYTKPDPAHLPPAGHGAPGFGYDYDLVGNISTIHDRTPGSGIPHPSLGTDPAATGALSHLRPALPPALRHRPRIRQRPPRAPWDDTPKCTDPTRTRAYSETYGYDPVGNILAAQAPGSAAARHPRLHLDSAAAPQQPPRAGDGRATRLRYTYDANGNLTSETTSRHFEWDHSDRMRAYRTQTAGAEPSVHAHYLYDAAGQRVKKLVRNKAAQVEVTVYIDGIFEHHR